MNNQALETAHRNYRVRRSTTTRRNPQTYAVPYIHKKNITLRSVPMTIKKVTNYRIARLLNMRKNLNKRIILAPSSRRGMLNYTNLHAQRKLINSKISKLRGMASSSKYISGPMFANMIKNMNSK
jgi:hypothetical protein